MAPFRSDTPAPIPPQDADDDASMDDETLFRGHRGPGVGTLASETPGRVDGVDRDADTVVVERRPRKADKVQISPEPVPAHIRAKVQDELKQQQIKTLTQVPLTREEKTRVNQLFKEEIAVVKAGHDRSEASSERESIIAAAKKRGTRAPSGEAQSYASRLKAQRAAKSHAGRADRNQGVKDSGMTSLPGVMVPPR